MMKMLMIYFFALTSPLIAKETPWQLGPFVRLNEINPVITPDAESSFYCPIQQREVSWESDHTFNPAAVVREGKVYLFYRAEDNYGQGIGKHTSRLGIAVSDDGIHFERNKAPVFYPKEDEQYASEWPGGCEDPRIVERDDGTYVMTYTQYDQKMAQLAVATSKDLFHWEKHGYVFAESGCPQRWSKSGSIICRKEGERLIATKINGVYWMYWGEKHIYAAISNDLISWTPLLDENYELYPLLSPRPGKFDSLLVEPGPPAVLTNEGIVFLYNGKNSRIWGDPNIVAGAYAAGQLLIDAENPMKLLERSMEPFFRPEMPYEKTGQYADGTVFIEGLVYFQGRWLLYYGCADSCVAVAEARP